MKKYLKNILTLGGSKTARDTYVLFSANVLSSILNFVITWIVARSLSISDFGVYSAAINLMMFIMRVADFGITVGMINFISYYWSKNLKIKFGEFTKAALIIKLISVLIVVAVVAVIEYTTSLNLLASTDNEYLYLVAVITIIYLLWNFIQRVLQSQRKFIQSSLVDLSLHVTRAVLIAVFFMLGVLTLRFSLITYLWGFLIVIILARYFLGTDILKTRPNVKVFTKLIRFSGWLGVSKIMSSITSKSDILMLAPAAGAYATGLYSVPSKLISFVILLCTSYSYVLIPRIAAFKNKTKELNYLKKSMSVIMAMVAGVMLWIFIANPFVTFFFGEKYLDSVPIFRILCIGIIPYIISIPANMIVIYAMKKTKFVGIISIIQTFIVLFLNYTFIQNFSSYGPAYTSIVSNIFFASLMWFAVFKYYLKKENT